ncbi:hypothetical protein [Methanomethylovorans sp.]|uniref:hypothetical protein n=1 Tax=Methanomethylovorans sp. TaxID=2758717 RepID=UPI00345E2FD4
MTSSKKIKNKTEKEKDITVVTVEEEIDNWCELSSQTSDSKNIVDMEIDDWCAGSKESEIQLEKKKNK